MFTNPKVIVPKKVNLTLCKNKLAPNAITATLERLNKKRYFNKLKNMHAYKEEEIAVNKHLCSCIGTSDLVAKSNKELKELVLTITKVINSSKN